MRASDACIAREHVQSWTGPGPIQSGARPSPPDRSSVSRPATCFSVGCGHTWRRWPTSLSPACALGDSSASRAAPRPRSAGRVPPGPAGRSHGRRQPWRRSLESRLARTRADGSRDLPGAPSKGWQRFPQTALTAGCFPVGGRQRRGWSGCGAEPTVVPVTSTRRSTSDVLPRRLRTPVGPDTEGTGQKAGPVEGRTVMPMRAPLSPERHTRQRSSAHHWQARQSRQGNRRQASGLLPLT